MTPLGVVNVGVEVVVMRAAGSRRGAVVRCGAAAVVRHRAAVASRCCVPGRGLLGHDGPSRLAAVRCRSPAVLRLRTVATVLPRRAGLAVCWLVCCCCVGYCGVPVVPVIGVRRRAHYPKPFFVVAFTFWLCFGRGRGGVSGQVEAGLERFVGPVRCVAHTNPHLPPRTLTNPHTHTLSQEHPFRSMSRMCTSVRQRDSV